MSKLTKFGLTGAIVTAICCFTPLLVWVLASVGLPGLIIYLDTILLPLLGGFIALMLYGFVTHNSA